MGNELDELVADIKQNEKEIEFAKKIGELERKKLIDELKNGLADKIKSSPQPIILKLTFGQKLKLFLKKLFNTI
jgi:hypothetical protein